MIVENIALDCIDLRMIHQWMVKRELSLNQRWKLDAFGLRGVDYLEIEPGCLTIHWIGSVHPGSVSRQPQQIAIVHRAAGYRRPQQFFQCPDCSRYVSKVFNVFGGHYHCRHKRRAGLWYRSQTLANDRPSGLKERLRKTKAQIDGLGTSYYVERPKRMTRARFNRLTRKAMKIEDTIDPDRRKLLRTIFNNRNKPKPKHWRVT